MKKVLPASTYLPCVEKESDFGRVIVGFDYLSYREKERYSMEYLMVQFNSVLFGVLTVTGGISMNGGKGNEE